MDKLNRGHDSLPQPSSSNTISSIPYFFLKWLSYFYLQVSVHQEFMFEANIKLMSYLQKNRIYFSWGGERDLFGLHV